MKKPLIASVCLALAVVAAGCGKAEDQGGNASGGGAQAPGVTDKTITLGALVDLTNVFAASSKSLLEGSNVLWNEVNAKGGICGHQVKLDVQDHGYDPQKAVSLYRDMSPNVLAMSPVLGSPIMTALLPSFQQDDMLVGMASWTSDVLPNPNIQVTGATYDIDMINAIDFLTREKGLKRGDSIGEVYFEGDYGGNALKGADFAAQKLGLTIVKQQITPADTDLSAQVSSFKSANVKAILVNAAPPQLASVAGVAASVGLDVPIMGNAPDWTPQLLSTPAGPALKKNFYTVSAIAPPSLQNKDVESFLTAFQKANPNDQPVQAGSMYGYAAGQIMAEALTRACQNKDLTRAGLLKALRSMKDYQTGTVAGALDYSNPAVPPAREDFIARVDPSSPGGMISVGDPFASDLAKQYGFGR